MRKHYSNKYIITNPNLCLTQVSNEIFILIPETLKPSERLFNKLE